MTNLSARDIKRDRDYLVSQIDEMKAGRFSMGSIGADGLTMINETQQGIVQRESIIAELNKLLADEGED